MSLEEVAVSRVRGRRGISESRQAKLTVGVVEPDRLDIGKAVVQRFEVGPELSRFRGLGPVKVIESLDRDINRQIGCLEQAAGVLGEVEG
jgi:hypothetical protein